MRISAWRIVKRKHARSAFTGDGARQFGGRWNSPGVAMIYTAESQSLAALEIMAHLESSELLEKYLLFEVKIDQRLISRISGVHLPARWAANPVQCRAIGDAWIAAGSSVALEIPSTIVPAEHNYLLNPRHPAFSRLQIGKPIHFRFDPRLAK